MTVADVELILGGDRSGFSPPLKSITEACRQARR